MIVRDIGDIAMATLEIADDLKGAPSLSLLNSLSRMAYYHRAQTELWRRLKRDPLLRAVFIYSYGDLCSPTVVLVLNTGDVLEKTMDRDFVPVGMFEDKCIDMLQDFELKIEEKR